MPNPSFSFGKLSQFATATIHQYQTLIQQSEPGFDWGFDFELPFEHLSVFARHIDTAAPITKLPVFCHAAFAIASKSDQNIPTHVVEKNLIFPDRKSVV